VAGTAAAVTVGVAIVAAPPHHDARPAGGRTAGVTAAVPTPGDTDPVIATPASTLDASRTPASPAAGHDSPSASASATTSTTPAAGTLTVSPATLDVTPPAVGAITLTASGGTAAWSVSEPPGLAKKVIVAPMSGTLAAGETTTVSVTVGGPGKMHVHLVFSPGGTKVTVVVG
jgi:hypothetical protein